MKKAKGLLLYVLIAVMISFCFSYESKAADTGVPYGVDNTNTFEKSSLVSTSNGYMRVFVKNDKEIGIEYYDTSFNLTSKKTIARQLQYWGNFYAGKDGYYYIVEGKANTAESDTAEVIRVTKYDKNWQKKGYASITGNKNLFGGVVRYPFDYGCVNFEEYGNKLYIVTGHQGYVDPAYNQGHQGFLMISVDKTTMKGSIIASDLWHSFAQYIKADSSDLYVLEQSEGSRCTTLSKRSAANGSLTKKIVVHNYGGSRDSAWAIACRASVDDLVIGKNNVIGLETSIDQTKYDDDAYNQIYNVYLTVTPKNNFTDSSTKLVKLTGNKSTTCKYKTSIAKINDNRFLVAWENVNNIGTATVNDPLSGHNMSYVFVDENGKKISDVFTAKAALSDCKPIVKSGYVVFYASKDNVVDFYKINATTGAFSKKTHRVLGGNLSWKVDSGILTISGTGKINSLDEDSHWFGGPWDDISDGIKKIVIKKGITSIGDNAFTNFSNLTQVNVESGVTSIGTQAFAFNNNLEKVYIPSTVTKIGEDVVWTGYYWTYDSSHVYRATIYSAKDSYAIKYAKAKGISYSVINPPAVTSISSISNASDGITLKWTKNSSATGYKVYRSVNGGSYSLVKTISGNATISWKDTAAKTNGNKYQYKLVAYKTVAGSTYSSAYSSVKTTYFLTRPTVTVLNVTTGVKVSWDKNLKATGYYIYKSTDGGKTYKNIKTITSNATVSYTDTAAKTNGAKYMYKVIAYKTVSGVTYKSAASAVKTRYFISKPVITSLTNSTSLKMLVKWASNSQSTGYEVIYSSSSDFANKQSVTATGTTGTIAKTISGLTKGKTYYVRVRTYKTVSGVKYYSVWSDSKSVKISK